MSGIKKINLADNAVSKETLYNDGDIAIGNSLRGSEGEDAFMFDFHVMVLCTGGEISFRINSTPYTMRKNDVLICPPDMIVSGIRKSDGMQCRSIATAVPTILLKNYINLCKSGCYERKIARWISESDFVL